MDPRWMNVARAAGLIDTTALGTAGVSRPTIFAEMSALAAATGSANLGQGFPDEDGPLWIREAAAAAIHAGMNQYPPGRGIAELRTAIADHQLRHYGLSVNPDTEVLVTAGATEALTAAILALTGPGDEVITLEPFYDSHAAAIAMAGATHVTVPLAPKDGAFEFEADALDAAVSPRTRMILVNTPHNPTGTVLSASDLTHIARAAARADALIVTDEVYEHLTFEGAVHTPLATLPGMRERTITISSAGKTFSLTGWKIGWAVGPAHLIEAVIAVKQFLTYTGGAPFQPAIAAALAGPNHDEVAAGMPSRGDSEIAELRARLATRRERLLAGLAASGFETVRPDGSYFVCADATPFLTSEVPDGAAFARWLPGAVGVACVPLSAFCTPGSPTATTLGNWVRFTFVKDDATINTAIERLAQLGDVVERARNTQR